MRVESTVWVNNPDLNIPLTVLLLICADFLASDFLIDNELLPLLQKAEEKGTHIIPLILKPCRFTRGKYLRQFQSINDPRKSLMRISEAEQEFYYDKAASEIEKSLQR